MVVATLLIKSVLTPLGGWFDNPFDLFVILRHILKIMKAKSSSQMGHFRRFFYPMFGKSVHATSASNVHATERQKYFLTKL